MTEPPTNRRGDWSLLRRLITRVQGALRQGRMARLQRLEAELGPYTMWGSGPYGASSRARQDRQIELAHLRQQLGLPQETNWLVEPVLRLYGIKG